jgi:hypothetical protein
VGAGLADALGLRPGSVLAAQLPAGGEVRFRVSGVVRALENDGRIAWVRPDRLLAADPGLGSSIVIALKPGADRAALDARLRRSARPPSAWAVRRLAAARSWVCSPRYCAGSGWRWGSCACTRSCRRWPSPRASAAAPWRCSAPTGADAVTVALVLGGAAAAVALPGRLAGVALARWAFAPLSAAWRPASRPSSPRAQRRPGAAGRAGLRRWAPRRRRSWRGG